MKNKLYIFIICICFICNSANSDIYKFKTKNIEIDGNNNKILAGKGTVVSNDGNLEIKANKFEYDKETQILDVSGNGYVNIKSKNLIIEFDNATFNQVNEIILAEGNVKLYRTDKNFKIETDKIKYQTGINLISSDTKTKLKDDSQNRFIFEKFSFNINDNILKVTNLDFTDKTKNKFVTPLAYINTESGNIFGKDVRIDLNNSSFNEQNQPRLKGRSLINDSTGTKITKGIFTTCKIRDSS